MRLYDGRMGVEYKSATKFNRNRRTFRPMFANLVVISNAIMLINLLIQVIVIFKYLIL